MAKRLHPARFWIHRDFPYAEGVLRQKNLLAEMAKNPDSPAGVILAEHRPTVTCGRSGDGGNLRMGLEGLAAGGVEFHRAGRGGDVTYHGPGQWTVYPVLRLEWYGRDLHRYLRLLEECAIRFLALYRIKAVRRPGLTGAWVGRDKAAAVGVSVSRWITWHGFALNIHPDLSRFTDLICPCGIPESEGGVTDLDSLTGRRHAMEETLPALRRALAEVLELEPAAGEDNRDFRDCCCNRPPAG
ncbi:MAG: lipoyl(octanoyl) transferase LipB [Planctomycetota bacterium]|jgi:lipoate-protein ligase B|nr:lipoyl(octanoyl) transferase LipB [Planctomycetota bacterium]